MIKTICSISLFFAIVLLSVCNAEAVPTMTTIQWSDTPAAVQKIIEHYNDGGSVERIEKAVKSDGRTFYEVIIKLPEKILTLEVAAKGQLTSFKYRHESFQNGIYFSSMSKAAQRTVAELINQKEITKVVKEFADENAIYEVRAITAYHDLVVLKVDEDGMLIELQTTKDPYWTPYQAHE